MPGAYNAVRCLPAIMFVCESRLRFYGILINRTCRAVDTLSLLSFANDALMYAISKSIGHQ